MASNRTGSVPAVSPSDVPWIHEQLAASAIAADGKGGLLLVAVDELSADPANVRRHPEKNHEATRASLKRFGQRTPIVVQSQGMVVRAGNDRLQLFREEGWTHIVALVVDENDVQATAYAIADNRTGELGEWDDEALSRQLRALDGEGIDLDELGFDAAEFDELLAAGGGGAEGEVDDPGPEEPPEVPASRLGDLWMLGDHRLLCGDSTKAADVARALDGERAALLSTDPPYCVNYTGKDRPVHDGKPSGKDWSHVYREIDIKDLGEFLDSVFDACLPHVDDGAAIYVWHAHVQQPTIAAVFERHGLLLHQVIIWVKPTGVFGHSYYRWRHEPCAFGWKKGNKPTHGTGKLDTVWELDWDGKARITSFHPTSKPTQVFEIPMEQHTKPGAVVFEPFSGSGSQIVAAEKTGRRCRAIELTPAFVDGTVLRWQKATGKTATLDGDGRSRCGGCGRRAEASNECSCPGFSTPAGRVDCRGSERDGGPSVRTLLRRTAVSSFVVSTSLSAERVRTGGGWRVGRPIGS